MIGRPSIQTMLAKLRPALEFLQNAQDVRSLGDLDTRFANVIGAFGFTVFQYSHLATPGRALSPKTLFGRPNSAWNERYRRERLWRDDPALDAIFQRARPFSWSDVRAPREGDHRTIFDKAAELDLTDGLVVPVHGPHGSVAGVQLAGRQCDLHPEIRPTLHALALMYGSIGLPLSELAFDAGPKRAFSPREKECLLWSARGKSDWDTGMILGLAERTVSMHCDRARARVGAHTRIQALATALKLGWITADEI